MNDFFATIMSWAVMLSGYPAPSAMPEIEMVPHRFLVSEACGGHECKVMGWFPPGDKIYLDNRLDLQNDLYAGSVLLHEMVHYLQQKSGTTAIHMTCVGNITAEREAYQAQRDYLLRYGVYHPVGVGMHNSHC